MVFIQWVFLVFAHLFAVMGLLSQKCFPAVPMCVLPCLDYYFAIIPVMLIYIYMDVYAVI